LTRTTRSSTGSVEYITGNVLIHADVAATICAGDIVVVLLGIDESVADTMSRGTSLILDAMEQLGCLG
jgi:hypothetical protein